MESGARWMTPSTPRPAQSAGPAWSKPSSTALRTPSSANSSGRKMALAYGDSVQVSVRLRPPLEVEVLPSATQGACDVADAVYVDAERGEVFVNADRAFRFDRVLGHKSSQTDVFDRCVRPLLVRAVEEGRAVSVLAYGQTGTGKTYTMGTEATAAAAAVSLASPLANSDLDTRGMIPRSLGHIFELLLEEENHVTVKAAYFEILKDNVFDLLNPQRLKVPLKLKEQGFGKKGNVFHQMSNLCLYFYTCILQSLYYRT